MINDIYIYKHLTYVSLRLTWFYIHIVYIYILAHCIWITPSLKLFWVFQHPSHLAPHRNHLAKGPKFHLAALAKECWVAARVVRNVRCGEGFLSSGDVILWPVVGTCGKIVYTLWIFNIAMENGPFIDGLPIRNGDFPWQTVSHSHMAMLVIARW